MTHQHVLEQQLRETREKLAKERERADRVTRELDFALAALTASENVRHDLVNTLAFVEVTRLRATRGEAA